MRGREKGIASIFIVIIVIALAAGSAVVYISTRPRPEFQVENLSLSSSKVAQGEPITAEVEIANVGDAKGTHEVKLELEGEIFATREVTLGPGESRTVSFDIVKQKRGTYSLDIGDLSKTLKVLEPAEFEVSNLSIIPSKVEAGENVIVSVTVQNNGELRGEYNLELKVDGKIENRKKLPLGVGKSKEITFNLKKKKEGMYKIEVENLSGIFCIEDPTPDLFAFYYPWYGTPKFSGRWVHWKDSNHNPNDYVDNRRDIAAAHYPLLDLYDSKNPDLIRKHIDIAKKAGIDAFVVSWWGVNSFSDKALSVIKRVCEEKGFRFTVYYEKTKSIGRTAKDINYLLNHYASSKCWYRIDNRPVLFIYVRARNQLHPYNFEWELSGSITHWKLAEDVRTPPRNSIFVFAPEKNGIGYLQKKSIKLPEGENYRLKAGISDIRNDCPPHSDVGFRIKIRKNNGKWEILDDRIVNFREGWKDLTYNISSFAGEQISIRVESYDGGEKKWCSEWPGADYLYIANSEGEIVTRNPYFDSGWKKVTERVKKKGYNPYYIIDFAGYENNMRSFANYYLAFMDGLHEYSPSSSISNLSSTYQKASKITNPLDNKTFTATVIPGYNDTEIRTPGRIVKRANGSYYNSVWTTAKSSNPDHYIITSFNEWHEGTEIEPSLEYGYRYVKLTAAHMENINSPDTPPVAS